MKQKSYLPSYQTLSVQSIHLQNISCMLHLSNSLCHRHICNIAIGSIHSVSLCDIFYKSFSLSFYILKKNIILQRLRTFGAEPQHNTCEGHITLQEQEKPWRTNGDSCNIQGEKTKCRAFMRVDKIETFLLLIDLIGEK